MGSHLEDMTGETDLIPSEALANIDAAIAKLALIPAELLWGSLVAGAVYFLARKAKTFLRRGAGSRRGRKSPPLYSFV